ncbi:MAG: hypothetical protein B1H04_00575 [Planctomycetales bacterium 4484_123]|nr:MAG: hypothetical protein B1H04_00575 [Planctomycetales bacterium 4484_123]
MTIRCLPRVMMTPLAVPRPCSSARAVPVWATFGPARVSPSFPAREAGVVGWATLAGPAGAAAPADSSVLVHLNFRPGAGLNFRHRRG